MFDPLHSPLELDPATRATFYDVVADTLSGTTELVAVLEIGSFAKGEAVPTSDLDTRVYVRAPDRYVCNLFHGPTPPPSFHAFLAQAPALPWTGLAWETFNLALLQRLRTALARPITLDIVDVRYVTYLLARLDHWAGDELSLLMQSNVVLDPQQFIAQQRTTLAGHRTPELMAYYRDRALQRLERRLPALLAPESFDAVKLDESGQIQWVAHAVRCLRDAVAVRTYAQSGSFCYRKDDVLAFLRAEVPAQAAFATELYQWKTDPAVRAAMVAQFRSDAAPLYAQFAAAMTPLTETIVAVLDLAENAINTDLNR